MSYKINFKDFNNEYTYVEYGDIKIQIMKKNGYINITELCKSGGKRFNHWNQNKSTKELMYCLSKHLGIKKEDLTIYVNHGSEFRVTFAHPDLVIHIAMWISPKFCINVNEIIKTWRQLSNENEIDYWNKMYESLKTSYKKDQTEEEVKNNLSKKLNGITEVLCESGYIDIVTSQEIIEVKHIDNWKHALGQVLSYHIDEKYNILQPRIHLFSESEIEVETKRKIINICSKYTCMVTFEIVEYNS